MFRLFLDKRKLHRRVNIFSSFTRIFRRNWLKIGRNVPGYLLRKTVSGFFLFRFRFKVTAPFVERNVRIENIKL